MVHENMFMNFMYLAVVRSGALFRMFGKVTFPLKGWKKGDQPNDRQGQKVGQGHFYHLVGIHSMAVMSQHPTKSLKQTGSSSKNMFFFVDVTVKIWVIFSGVYEKTLS